jgi:hypothetical protein
MSEHDMKDREFQSQQAIVKASAKSWDDLTFADVQRVSQEWIKRLTRVVGNNGKYYPNPTHQLRKRCTVE